MTADLFAFRTSHRCALCGGSIVKGDDIYIVLETQLPGMQDAGDPMRLVSWHAECAPDWVKEGENEENG